MDKDEFEKKVLDISSTFLSIKSKIGAQDVEFTIIPRELKTPMGKFNAGKPVTGSELQRISENWKSKEPLIDEEGNAFVLFISDFSSNHFRKDFLPTSLPKYHLSWCRTLRDMNDRGRMERYIKKTDIETNLFQGRKGNDESIEAVLYACKNCRTIMSGIYGNNLYFDVKGMDILKFFEMYGNQHLHDPHTNKSYSVMYPKHWSEISRKYREKADWKCQECGESFRDRKYLLDVHHLNGIRSDVRESNLVVLCKEHHAQQPNHGHYKKFAGL